MNPFTKMGVSGVLATGAMLYAVGANAAPAPKATGHVSWTTAASSATLQFSVQEAVNDRDARGSFTYRERLNDGTSVYYRVTVECVDVDEETGTATFSGRILDTNVDEWEGSGVQIWVQDSGEKGGEGDAIGGAFFDWAVDDPDTEDVDESEANCLPLDEAPGWIDVERGNIVVHDSQVGQGHNNGNPQGPKER